ncbi:hydrogenase expression/formation protein HypE [Paenibacillus chungangensis]|uniref:Hydrogenase expression/formation protein HypE n=1 Tax=Paenibacillus chungangensis TaxID=696535 RepID=A0ABW3HNL0_9BACL
MRRKRQSGNIVLAHGDGGQLTQDLVKEVFLPYFDDPALLEQNDATSLTIDTRQISVSTDSFVIQPLEFPGGDIGKLAVAGTVNDLAVSGARPAFLTVGFVLEEGFEIETLKKFVYSMAITAHEAGVRIVAGDTKVVERGMCGGAIINTTGIGFMEHPGKFAYRNIQAGDRIVINGGIAEHAITILATRAELEFSPPVMSDCQVLRPVIDRVLERFATVRFMRDPTRGGIATALKEIALLTNLDMTLQEEAIPIQSAIQGALEVMGMDPLYLANEGKVLFIVASNEAAELVDFLRSIPGNELACEIGHTQEGNGTLWLQTAIGGMRELGMLSGTPLPRIC